MVFDDFIVGCVVFFIFFLNIDGVILVVIINMDRKINKFERIFFYLIFCFGIFFVI